MSLDSLAYRRHRHSRKTTWPPPQWPNWSTSRRLFTVGAAAGWMPFHRADHQDADDDEGRLVEEVAQRERADDAAA